VSERLYLHKLDVRVICDSEVLQIALIRLIESSRGYDRLDLDIKDKTVLVNIESISKRVLFPTSIRALF
jgi:hypothetical protein